MDVALPFASCFLLLPSSLGNSCKMAAQIIVAPAVVQPVPRRTLLTMTEAFPDGLPPPPANMPNWSPMDYDQFAGFYRTVDLGCFQIPLANVNVHSAQRPQDTKWLTDLRARFLTDGILANANPGVAILNTQDLPLDEDGNPDPLQMLVSIIDGQHRCAARFGMEGPDSEKTWILRVFGFGTF
jgi:hypothetical protein